MSVNIHCVKHEGEECCRAQPACNISKDSRRSQPPPLPANAHKNCDGTSYIPTADNTIKTNSRKLRFSIFDFHRDLIYDDI